MSKPTSPTDKTGACPKGLKLYTYGKLEFVVHPGGQPPRRFDINWMKEEPSTSTSGRESANEDPNKDYRRG